MTLHFSHILPFWRISFIISHFSSFFHQIPSIFENSTVSTLFYQILPFLMGFLLFSIEYSRMFHRIMLVGIRQINQIHLILWLTFGGYNQYGIYQQSLRFLLFLSSSYCHQVIFLIRRSLLAQALSIILSIRCIQAKVDVEIPSDEWQLISQFK